MITDVTNSPLMKIHKKRNFLTSHLKTKNVNEPFSSDKLLQSPYNFHDTALGPDQIHYQVLKHLPSKNNACLLQILKKK